MVEKGKRSEIVGPKTSIEAMSINLPNDYLTSTIQPLFTCQKIGIQEPVINLLPDFTPIIFNPANQIIHPAVYWSHFRSFNGKDPILRTDVVDTYSVTKFGEQPKTVQGKKTPGVWLYRDMDETAGIVLQTLDEELHRVKNAYYAATKSKGCEGILTLHDRLLAQYGSQISDVSSMANMVSTNAAYSMAKTPVLETQLKGGTAVKPFPTHRVVQDDIGWGLCVLVSIAERLELEPSMRGRKIPVDMMKHCISWHQQIMGKEFLVNGKLTGKDCVELVLVKPSDPLEMVSGVGYIDGSVSKKPSPASKPATAPGSGLAAPMTA